MSGGAGRNGGQRCLGFPFPESTPPRINHSVLTAKVNSEPREGRGPNGDPVTLLLVEFPVADPTHPRLLRTWASCLVEVTDEGARDTARELHGGAPVLMSGQLSSRWVIENGETSRRGVIVATLLKAGPSDSQLVIAQ